MSIFLYGLGFGLLGYLAGSLPFAIWVTRWRKGVDVRNSGSGHATATNTLRQAGFAAGLLVFVLDFLKGYLPVWLALQYGQAGWMAPVTAGLVVVGHCWPVWAQFRGGMGLAAGGGGICAASPLGFLIGLAVLIVLVLIIRHSARASVFAGVAIPLVFWLSGQPPTPLGIAAAVGVVISLRFLIDWNRTYRELWLDRDR